jgi:hypothetical protein
MAHLADIYYTFTRRTQPKRVAKTLSTAYPAPQDMRSLKYALFGPADASPGLWDIHEGARIETLIEAAEPGLDINDLDLPGRLDRLWRTDRALSIGLLNLVDEDDDARTLAQSLVVKGAVDNIAANELPRIAGQHSEIALDALRRHREYLGDIAIWSNDETRELAAELLRELDADARLAIFASLLDGPHTAGLISAIQVDPPLWWTALRGLAELGPTKARADLARKLISSVGDAAVGPPPSKLRDAAVLTLLAAASDPRYGLWRQVRASDWARAVEGAIPLEKRVQHRLLVIALASMQTSESASVRRRLWQETFGPLHDALLSETIEGRYWKLLDRILPGGSNDNQASRLRLGLVQSIKRDDWQAEDVEPVLLAAGRYGRDILQAVMPKKKSKRKWIKDVADSLGFKPFW